MGSVGLPTLPQRSLWLLTRGALCATFARWRSSFDVEVWVFQSSILCFGSLLYFKSQSRKCELCVVTGRGLKYRGARMQPLKRGPEA